MTHVIPLFSNPLAVFEVENLEQHYPEIMESVEFLADPDNYFTNVVRADGQKWDLLDQFPIVKDAIMQYFKQYVEDVFLFKDTTFKMTTSWLTKTGKGQKAGPHNHKNSYFSGVLYMTEDPNQAPLKFVSPISDLQTILITPREFNIWNSSHWTLPVNKNMLIFFPSYLRHQILTSTSEIDRYSIAFNFFPEGEFFHYDSTIKLTIG